MFDLDNMFVQKNKRLIFLVVRWLVRSGVSSLSVALVRDLRQRDWHWRKVCCMPLSHGPLLTPICHSNYATMRFEPEALHGANNGLHIARGLMEDVKKEFPWISYGDLWTLGGVCAIQEMGGPKIPWRPGRIDGFAHQATPDGRLPDGAQGSDHLRNVSHSFHPWLDTVAHLWSRVTPDLLPHGVCCFPLAP